MITEEQKESIKDILENVRSVKGDNFVTCVQHCINLLGIHITMIRMSEDLGAENIPPMVQIVFMRVLQDLMDAYGFQDKEVEEIMRWTHNIMEQLNKKGTE